eukprot:1148089-Pelagomonas_calceolata.AAC.1
MHTCSFCTILHNILISSIHVLDNRQQRGGHADAAEVLIKYNFQGNVIGTLFKLKSTLSWVALLRIELTCALSTCFFVHPQVVHHVSDFMNQADSLVLKVDTSELSSRLSVDIHTSLVWLQAPFASAKLPLKADWTGSITGTVCFN